MGEMGVVGWKEGGRKERYPVFLDFTFLASPTSLWTGNHELEVACPPADIQLLCCPTPPPPHTHPSHPPQGSCLEIQLSSGRRRCCLLSTHMSEVSAVFLNQKITLSFVSN